jgi:hypothetical protein
VPPNFQAVYIENEIIEAKLSHAGLLLLQLAARVDGPYLFHLVAAHPVNAFV